MNDEPDEPIALGTPVIICASGLRGIITDRTPCTHAGSHSPWVYVVTPVGIFHDHQFHMRIQK